MRNLKAQLKNGQRSCTSDFRPAMLDVDSKTSSDSTIKENDSADEIKRLFPKPDSRTSFASEKSASQVQQQTECSADRPNFTSNAKSRMLSGQRLSERVINPRPAPFLPEKPGEAIRQPESAKLIPQTPTRGLLLRQLVKAWS